MVYLLKHKQKKFEQLFSDPGISVKNINEAIKTLQKNNVNYLIEPQIEDLRSFYKLENLKEHPKKLEIASGTKVKGRVVACKGNLIFLENGAGVHAINANRLVGRIVEDGGAV